MMQGDGGTRRREEVRVRQQCRAAPLGVETGPAAEAAPMHTPMSVHGRCKGSGTGVIGGGSGWVVLDGGGGVQSAT